MDSCVEISKTSGFIVRKSKVKDWYYTRYGETDFPMAADLDVYVYIRFKMVDDVWQTAGTRMQTSLTVIDIYHISTSDHLCRSVDK